MTTIYLLRHGKAAFASDDYDQLDPLGVRQAACLGKALAACGVREPLLFSGAMRRHRQTLDACVAAMGAASAAGAASATDPAVILPGWNEFDHQSILQAVAPGDAAALRARLAAEPDPGRAFQRLFAAAVTRWVAGAHEDEYSETWNAFRSRVSAALTTVVAALADGRDALVATSGGPIAVVMQQLLGLTDARAVEVNWTIVNGSYTSVAVGRRNLRLASFNVVQHLAQAGPEMLTYR